MSEEIGAVSSVPNISPSDIEGVEGKDGSNNQAKEAEKARLEAKREDLQEKLERCRAQHGTGQAGGNHQAEEASLRSQIGTVDSQISQVDS